MTSLLNLKPSKRKELFISKMKELALNEEQDKRPYSLGSRDDGNSNINLNNLVFVANNPYELWLIVYEYLNKNISYQKKVISLDRISKTEIILNNKIVPEDEDDNNFQMYDDEDIIDSIEYLMEGDTDDDIKMEDLIEEVIENFFKNDYFWAREINDIEYITDEDDDDEDDDDENDSE